MKQFFSLMLALAMLLSLAACAASTPESAPSEPAQTASSAQAPADHTSEEAPAEPHQPEESQQTPAAADTAPNTEAVTEPAAHAEPAANSAAETAPETIDATDPRTLIAYFSCTGTTRAAAEQLAALLDADLVEILPETPYTSDDLNYNSDCRANREQNDPDARPALAAAAPDLSGYDTVLLGYPIWWGTMPKIINTFIESCDFSGKLVLPFCTSGSSSISQSVSALQDALPSADVRDGLRMNGVSTDDLRLWLTENGIQPLA